MPAVTYLSDSDIQRHAASLDPEADCDLIELLQEANSYQPGQWSLRKDVYSRGFFRKPSVVFSLYCYVSGPEWQCIHFSNGENGDGSWGLSRKEMANFLLGFRMGWHEAKRKGDSI